MFRPAASAILLVAAAAVQAQPLPDPTEPTSLGRATPVADAAPRYILHSTLIAADRRLAVVNGETVAVGARVGGARVVRIDAYGVHLRGADGTTIELTLSGSDPKRAADGDKDS